MTVKQRVESGMAFPIEAYAFIPTNSTPDGWQLRMWESPEKQTTRKQLGRAVAALSPGGFKGKRVQVPAAERAKVKARMRAAYTGLGVPDHEIPRWIQEKETMERCFAANTVSLDEAKYDTDKGEATITIIKPGFNVSKGRFYPREVLKRDHKIFEGLKMFADHPTDQEERERPEGSVRKWVANVRETWAENDGTVKGRVAVVENWMKDKLRTLQEQDLLKEMGTSIRAIGQGVKTKVEGVNTILVEKLLKGRSVDFVTYAGAGGAVDLYESSGDVENDIDIVTAEGLKARRPDLIRDVREIILKEVSSEMEETTELKNQVAAMEAEKTAEAEKTKTIVEENAKLKADATEAQRMTAKAKAQTDLKEALAKVEDLSEIVKERISQQFTEAENLDNLEKVIKQERDYLAKLTEAGTVKNLGGNGEEDKGDAEKAGAALTATLVESYRRQGVPEDKAKEMAANAIRGR